MNRFLDPLRRLYLLDPGLWRCCVVLIAILWGFYGKGLQRGRSPTRVDIYCDDAPWRDSCVQQVQDPLNGDYSPALVNYPYEWWNAHELHHWRMPAWNPRQALGTPTRVTFQGSALSPFRIPFYIHPSPRTYDFGLLMQLFCAGFFAFLLARKLGAGDTGGLLAALAYMLSGFLTAYIAFSLAPAAAVLPMLLYSIECLFQRPSWRAALAMSLALAATLTLGHPSNLFLSPQAGVLYFLTRAVQLAWKRDWATFRRFALFGTAAGGIALLIVAGPWLGFVEFLKNGYSYHNETRGDREMERSLDLMGRFRVPALLAPRVLEAFRGVGRDKVPFPHSVTPYVGIPVLALIGVALVRRKMPAPIIVVLIWAVAIAYGPGPLEKIRYLPGYEKVFFFYAYYLSTLMFAVGAALGVVELAKASWRWPVGVAVLAVTILAAGAGTIGRTRVPPKYVTQWKTFVVNEVDSVTGVLRFWPGLWLFAGTALALGIPRRTRKFVPLALTFATAADLVWCTSTAREKAMAFDPGRRRSEAVEFLRDHGMMEPGAQRITGHDWRSPMVNGATLLGLRDVRQTDALQVDRYTAYMKSMDPSNVTSFPTFRVTAHYYSPMLDVLGVRYILRERSSAKDYWKWRHHVAPAPKDPLGQLENDFDQPLVFSDESVAVYENHRAMPRAFLLGDAILAHNRGLAHGQVVGLGRAGTDGQTVASTVVIEPATELFGVPTALKPAEPAPGVTPSVTWLRDDPNDQKLDVVAARDGYLVVSDTFYPGWKAFIDGKRTPIFPANVALRAVYLTPGHHVVDFRYRPTWRTVESWISLPALFFALAAWIIFVSRDRASRRAEKSATNP